MTDPLPKPQRYSDDKNTMYGNRFLMDPEGCWITYTGSKLREDAIIKRLEDIKDFIINASDCDTGDIFDKAQKIYLLERLNPLIEDIKWREQVK